MTENDHPRSDLALSITGDLDPAAAARLGAHLAGCDPCRRELAELRATIDAIRSIDEATRPLPAALAAISTSPAPAVRPTSRLLRFTAAAALFLAGLLAGRALSSGPSAPAELGVRTPRWAEEASVQRTHGLGQALIALRAAREMR